jgi:flagellar hook-length control protein FliK
VKILDIGLLQMTQSAPQPVKQSTSTTTATSESSFDKVFNKAVQSSSVENDTNANSLTKATASQTVEEEAAQVVEEVSEVLVAESLKEVLDVLLIEHDEALLFIEVEGEIKPVDEVMNLQDLAALLDMSVEEFQQIITQLTEGQAETTDVWQVLEQAPQLLAQIASVLQGENQLVTPKEAGQLVKLLQLAQLLGQQSDTVYKQEIALTDAKSALQLFSAQLNENTQQQPKQNFVQVLQQTLNTHQVHTSTVQTMKTQESNDQVQPLTQQVQTQQGVKTISVVLPAERSAQSEALIKELQNQISRTQLSNNNGTVKLMMRLFPENLGQIRIEIMQQDGVMQARILATTAAGKELLDSNLNQLKTSLVAQNIQMDRIDIAQSLQSSDSSRDQGLFNQFFRHQQSEPEQEQEGEGDEELVTFEELLQEQLVAEEV